jgi:hypothetical protein
MVRDPRAPHYSPQSGPHPSHHPNFSNNNYRTGPILTPVGGPPAPSSALRGVFHPRYSNSAYMAGRTRSNSGNYNNPRNYQPDPSASNQSSSQQRNSGTSSGAYQRVFINPEVPARNWPNVGSSSDSEDGDDTNSSTNRKRHHSRSEISNVAKKVAPIRVKQPPPSPNEAPAGGSSSSGDTLAIVKRESECESERAIKQETRSEPTNVKMEAEDQPVAKQETNTSVDAEVKTEPAESSSNSGRNVLCDCSNCFPYLSEHDRPNASEQNNKKNNTCKKKDIKCEKSDKVVTTAAVKQERET